MTYKVPGFRVSKKDLRGGGMFKTAAEARAYRKGYLAGHKDGYIQALEEVM